MTLYNRGQTEVDIPERYDTITGNRKDYAAFETQMAETRRFDAVIDMIGFVPVDWLDTRGRVHDQDEPEVYSEIIEKWQHLSRKETFFGKTDSARQ